MSDEKDIAKKMVFAEGIIARISEKGTARRVYAQGEPVPDFLLADKALAKYFVAAEKTKTTK